MKKKFGVVEAFFLVVFVGLTLAFYRLMAPFLLAIFIAIVFVRVFRRVYRFFENLWRGKARLASACTVLVAFIVVAIPAATVSAIVYAEAVGGYNTIVQRWPELTQALRDVELLDRFRGLPFIGSFLADLQSIPLEQILRESLSAGSSFIIEITQRSFVSVTMTMLNFVVVLFVMFFLFVDGPGFVEKIRDAIPMPNSEFDQIVRETLNTTSATLISTVIIGLIEGAYATVLFLAFGLPSPFLWGVIVMILSMIPLVGTNLVLLPAGFILIATGRVVSGLLLIVLGFGGVALTQNVLRPVLLGGRTGLHPALVLFATIGGIAWLGLIGFLVGPVVASLFIVVWRIFTRRYAEELQMKNTAD